MKQTPTDGPPVFIINALVTVVATAVATLIVTFLAIQPQLDAQHEAWKRQAGLEMHFERLRDKIDYARELIGLVHAFQSAFGEMELASYDATLSLAL